MFALDLAPVRPAKNPHECCDACREAREIKCVWACGGKDHGANRAGMSPLDRLLQNEFPIGPPRPDELVTW
jgi:hypothetical protein